MVSKCSEMWFGPFQAWIHLDFQHVTKQVEYASTYLKTWKGASPADRLLEASASAEHVSATFGFDAKLTVKARTRPIDLHPYDPNERGQEDTFLVKGKLYVQRDARALWPEFLGFCWLSQFFHVHALGFCGRRVSTWLSSSTRLLSPRCTHEETIFQG